MVQALAACVSIGLLIWFVRMLASPEHQESLRTIRDASWHLIALIGVLSLVSLVLNGLTFWCTMQPVRRLSLARVMSVQAVAALLAYLPFKLSVVARFLIHARRDDIPVLTIGAWMAANAIVILAGVAPPLLAALWRGGVDGPFFLASIAMYALLYAIMLGGARLFAGTRGHARIAAAAASTRLGFLSRSVEAGAFRRLHAGFDMLASPLWLALALLTRVADQLVVAARFSVAGEAAGVHMPWDSSLIAGATFFLSGVLSPAGALGAREVATSGLASLREIPGVPRATFDALTAAVSAVEMVVVLAAAIVATLWILWTAYRTRGPGAE